MADPLTAVADQYAPAPLNFFDAGAAESIISRHANSRRGLAATDAALSVMGRAQGLQADQERMARNRILQDREDRDYEEKLANREDRAGFLGDLMEFDHTAPDANTKFTGLLKGIAETTPTLLEDPATKAILDAKSRQIDRAEAERYQREEMGIRQKNALALTRERAKYQDAFKYLKKEDLDNLPLDENGQPDMFAAGILAGQRKREAGIEDFGKKTEITKEARKELLDVAKMDDKQKARFNETKLILIENKEAFPDETDLVRQEALAKGKSESLVNNTKYFSQDKDFGQKFQKAKERDRDKFAAEVNAAKRFKTPEEFVEARGAEISEEAKEARRRVWEYAHQNDEEPKAGTTDAPKAGTPREEVIKVNGKWIRRRWVDE